MTYISGPITGRPNYNLAAFESAAAFLLADGQAVHNPCDPSNVRPNLTWSDYMRADIAHLMRCNRIYMLHGWHRSSGAVVEFFLALILGFRIDFEEGQCAEIVTLSAFWRFSCRLWRNLLDYRRKAHHRTPRRRIGESS